VDIQFDQDMLYYIVLYSYYMYGLQFKLLNSMIECSLTRGLAWMSRVYMVIGSNPTGVRFVLLLAIITRLQAVTTTTNLPPPHFTVFFLERTHCVITYSVLDFSDIASNFRTVIICVC